MASLVFSIILLLLVSLTILKADIVKELATKAGYPVDLHQYTSADGYKLTIHRISPKPGVAINNRTGNGNQSRSRESVLLVHGVYCSGSVWIARNAEKSLGFNLVDAGFDVWLFHARGTSYSIGHKKLNTESPEYWSYSWHEMGYYDMPAVIDYILKKTLQKKIHYVCHSQGCAVLMVLLSTKPKYNQKIGSTFFIAPAVYLTHLEGLARLFAPYKNEIRDFMMSIHMYYIEPGSPTIRALFDYFCVKMQTKDWLCIEMMYAIIGPDSGQIDTSNIFDLVNKYVLDNISVKQLVHFAQTVNSGIFRWFDYESNNLKFYGSMSPPQYNISAVTIPIAIIHGTEDFLVSVKDVRHLISKLRNVKSVVKLPWNHADFLFGVDAPAKVNKYIIESIKKDLQ